MREKRFFQFKKFCVYHDRCAMKVGTDAVVLATWVDINEVQTILDIGTGSGIISLILAQRTTQLTLIDAIEIATEDVLQAVENVARSPWPQKIKVHHESLMDFNIQKQYDLIVTNPPYFNNSQLPPSVRRSRARHTNELSYEMLLLHSLRLLSPEGTLALILPTKEGVQFEEAANQKGYYTIRRMALFSRQEKSQERWLYEFKLQYKPLKEEKLVIHAQSDSRSLEYILLTREFYL